MHGVHSTSTLFYCRTLRIIVHGKNLRRLGLGTRAGASARRAIPAVDV